MSCIFDYSVLQEVLKVYADGRSVQQDFNDMLYHIVRVEHYSATGQCEMLLDGEVLSTFRLTEQPSYFWFGSLNEIYLGIERLAVDYANVWTFRGDWMSKPYDFGHEVDVDGLKGIWTTTHGTSAKASMEVRTSVDNASWSEWTRATNVGAESPLRCRYIQLRVNASLLDVKSEVAAVSFRSFDITYRNPIVSVEARRAGGEWMLATGNESWTVALNLEEDANVVEILATDTSGATNETRLNVTVDTTPPVGTVSIVTDRQYLNDPNVTLSLNASDRYGVTTVQVSNAPDMARMSEFTYCQELPWRIEGIDGEVFVYVRFVDSHGLFSEIMQDSVIYDSLPPSGSLLIDDGAVYATNTTVRLDLDYNDNQGMATIELSNRPDMEDALSVMPPQVEVDAWELEGGDDGPRTVYMRMTDVAGNVAIAKDTIELYIPKALGNVTIEEGADLTGKSIVQLQITIPLELRARRMQLSNEADFEGAAWENLAREMLWILSPGDGLKTVHLRFEDFRGILSLPVNSSITLDTTPPDIQVLLEDGAPLTTISNLTATIVYEDTSPPSRMWLADDDELDRVRPQPFFETFPWEIPAREGDHCLYVMVEDLAGNAAVTSTRIHFCTSRPYLVLGLPDGKVSAAVTTLEVVAEVTDAYGGVEVQVVFGTNPTDGDPWLPPDSTLLVQIPPGTQDGTYELKGRARNAAGLVSEVMWIPVVLDRTGPIISIIEPLEGATLSQEERRIMLRYTVKEPNGVSEVSFRVDGGEWVPLTETDGTATLEVADFGEHTVEVRASDVVGNPSVSSVTFDVERPEDTRRGWVVPGILILSIVLTVVGVYFYLSAHRRT